ncbi:MAG: hypothetical protein JWP36_716 [Paucimonas sp.]|nr:hypothetical protein [Paucimonas sp.]
MRGLHLLTTALLLAGCASNPANQAGSGNVEILAVSQGQAVAGAQCVAANAAGRWDFTAPATLQTGAPAGDLRVSCSKPGYRSSEVLYRPGPYSGVGGGGYPNVGVGVGGGSGGVGVGFGFNLPIGGTGGASAGGYPPRIVVEMNPQ